MFELPLIWSVWTSCGRRRNILQGRILVSRTDWVSMSCRRNTLLRLSLRTVANCRWHITLWAMRLLRQGRRLVLVFHLIWMVTLIHRIRSIWIWRHPIGSRISRTLGIIEISIWGSISIWIIPLIRVLIIWLPVDCRHWIEKLPSGWAQEEFGYPAQEFQNQ